MSNWQADASLDDTSATPGATYYYWVKAKNTCGQESGYSDPDTGWRRLSAPANVSASDGTYGFCVQIGWAGVEGASHYRVYRRVTGGPSTVVAIPISDWLPFTKFVRTFTGNPR